ncbi:MAG: DUF192 domain-containing protein [Terriglobales bacterium]
MSDNHHKKGYAYNKTRQTFLARELRVADTHWTRLRGLMGSSQESFSPGHGLWIVPCHGVHTMMMRYAIDVVYLNEQNLVVQIEENVKPWRMTPMNLEAMTVLELPSHAVWNTGTKVGDQLEMVRERSQQAVA